MSPKTKSTKTTGINKAIENANADKFQSRVICKKCGKDIEFTKGVELHLDCPRCKTKLERDLGKEAKHAKKIINYAWFMKNKKYFLYVSFGLAIAAIIYNVALFFTQVFANDLWWLALMSIPLVIFSVVFTSFPRLKSTRIKHRIFAWATLVLNVIAIAAIVTTSIPELNDRLLDWYTIKKG